MNTYLNFNGELRPAEQPLINAGNRGFRYGDGLFETMLSNRGVLPFENFHFQRLASGMKTMAFILPGALSPSNLRTQIKELLERNGHLTRARVRLTVFRKDGNLYDNDYQAPQYIIESSPLPESAMLNEKGLKIDIYPHARKSQDLFSTIKTNNFIPYVMAAIYAKEQQLDDCILLNTGNRICDATIANVFFIKNGQVFTPSLQEGCIAGVMRRYLFESIPSLGYTVTESAVEQGELLAADEIFLTNAVSGMRWVKNLGSKEYHAGITHEIYQRLLSELL